MKKSVSFTLAGTLAAVLLTLLSAGVQAQTVYRIVGPDGRVTFSDTPPPAAVAKPASKTGSTTMASTAAAGNLPFELRQVVNRYPVTLYTGNDCVPCGAGRALLTSRGVPFVERTINTNEDTQALQRLSGDNSLPFVTIGGQQLKGFSDVEWTQFLDAAGYPKTSQLPANYRNAPASPLVAVQAPATPAQGQGQATAGADGAEPAITTVNRRPAPAPARAPTTNAENPAGIKF